MVGGTSLRGVNGRDESAPEAGRGQAIAPTMDGLRKLIHRSIVGAMACPVHHRAWLANTLSSCLCLDSYRCIDWQYRCSNHT